MEFTKCAQTLCHFHRPPTNDIFKKIENTTLVVAEFQESKAEKASVLIHLTFQSMGEQLMGEALSKTSLPGSVSCMAFDLSMYIFHDTCGQSGTESL